MKSQVTALSVYGLEDLIAGITPTFSGWTNDPTDAGDITDDDITTFCTTGDKVISAGWQYAYFEWDLGTFYNILTSGIGACNASAGYQHVYLFLFDGSAWIKCRDFLTGYSNTEQIFVAMGGICSKVRIGITSSAAATIAPKIREFHVWRLE